MHILCHWVFNFGGEEADDNKYINNNNNNNNNNNDKIIIIIILLLIIITLFTLQNGSADTIVNSTHWYKPICS